METPDTHASTTEDIAAAEVAGDQETKVVETSPAEEQSHDRIFQHSRHLHVGPGAEECEDVDEETFVCNCGNPLHFHAWLHTPNQFQHNSIRTKALAAKARKLRALRDLESDSRVILDGEMEQIRFEGNREILIEEIANKDSVRNYWQAMREVQEEEEFQHYEDDRNRLNALAAMEPDKRDEEEYEALGNHISKYHDRVREVITSIEKPLRDSLEEKDMDALVEIVTEDRIQAEAQSEFDDVYSLWEWYIGCLQLKSKVSAGHPNERYYSDIEKLKAAPTEVISALASAFTELDAEAARSLGNS
jgi:hypothetical protein